MGASEAELDQIYVDYVERIRRYLVRLSGDPCLAEDLVQEVFYRAMRQMLLGTRIDYISAWLYRIARNLYLDHLRRARPPTEPIDELSERQAEPASRVGVPEAELSGQEERDRIAAIIAALPEAQQTALILRDVEGLAYEEVAGAMQLSLSAVKSLIFRARRRFTELYGESEEDA